MTVGLATGEILRLVSPKFGQLVAEESNRKGHWRHLHSRIITNAEEIAFYGGQEVEKAGLKRAHRSLLKQTYTIMGQKLWYVMLEQFLLKYGWAGVGMFVMAIPIFTSKNDDQEKSGGADEFDTVSENTEYYTTGIGTL